MQPGTILEPALAPTAAETGLAPREALKKLAAMGFRAVQLSATQPGLRPRELDRSARRDLLAALRRSELVLSGLDCWIPAEHFTDPQRMDRAGAALLAMIEMAGELDRCPVSIVLPDDCGGMEALLDEVRGHADRFGVRLADHAVTPAGPPWTGVGIDPAAWLAAGADPAAGVGRFADRLVCARLVDLLRTGLRGPIGSGGAGRLDVLAYRVALSVGGYDRPVVVDARQWVDPLGGFEATKACWDRGGR
jgi:sugar phosphate isomerase/epimerase